MIYAGNTTLAELKYNVNVHHMDANDANKMRGYPFQILYIFYLTIYKFTPVVKFTHIA